MRRDARCTDRLLQLAYEVAVAFAAFAAIWSWIGLVPLLGLNACGVWLFSNRLRAGSRYMHRPMSYASCMLLSLSFYSLPIIVAGGRGGLVRSVLVAFSVLAVGALMLPRRRDPREGTGRLRWRPLSRSEAE